MGAPIIVAAVYAGTQIYGALKGGSDRAAAAEAEAALKNQQADELMSRELVNEGVMQRQGAYEGLQLGGRYNGLAGGNVGDVIAARNNMDEAIRNSNRDAEFKAKMLRAGADIDMRLASDAISSSYIGAVGAGVGAVASMYGKLGNFGSTSDLGKAPTVTGPSYASTGASYAPVAQTPAPSQTYTLGGGDQFGTQWWR